jgi:hypothetical protein
VEIGRGLRIIANNQMVKLRIYFPLKYATDDKCRCTSMEVFKVDPLGLGKSEPVRQLKKAGGITKGRQQLLQIHNGDAKITFVL